MSPTLSRENYFLSVLNQFAEDDVKSESLEKQLQELILDIAYLIRDKITIGSEIMDRANSIFIKYNAVHLKVALVSEISLDRDVKRGKDAENQILLHTEFIDEPNELKRIYMEALISIFEAIEKGNLELQQCIQCNQWFIPYKRAQIAKFCSSKCRNRYNYLNTKTEKKEVRV